MGKRRKKKTWAAKLLDRPLSKLEKERAEQMQAALKHRTPKPYGQ